ncbi:hypothetical protein RND71_035166 [Anisodus tanguticus]|uniref:Uncharacterized protein n=1 Tax=Anisodus tanguticus TaxID=243964 RepID=A0AAE1R409_9SOLA|nr:hypothetical protein RND71_035166 [Anisodus tanguticus]
MKGPAMIKNSYPPAFPLKHQKKDIRLALALEDENAGNKLHSPCTYIEKRVWDKSPLKKFLVRELARKFQ